MYNTVLIEDDPFQMEVLSDLLLAHFPQVHVVGNAVSAEDAVKTVKELTPDLVFLDIDLQDKTGFDVINDLPGHFFDFVFVTAHEKFAVQAHRFDALSFILKPISRESIQSALGKLDQKKRNQVDLSQVRTIINELKLLYDNQQKIAVATLKEINYIKVNEIVHLEADGNYTTIHLTNRESIIASANIGDYEKQLSRDRFFRIHDKYLVNLRYVKSFSKGLPPAVVMEDSRRLPVSRRRKEEFLKALGHLFP